MTDDMHPQKGHERSNEILPILSARSNTDLSEVFFPSDPTDNSRLAGNWCSREEFMKSWSNLDDPRAHNPQAFRYLVHAINPMAVFTLPSLYLEVALETDKDADAATTQGLPVNLFDTPMRVADRPTLSMSLIDQNHSATWGPAGLILKVPPENILSTNEQDAGWLNTHGGNLGSETHRYSKHTVDQLLAMTSPFSYNEVFAKVNTESGGSIEVVGFFYKSTPGGRPHDRSLKERFQEHALRYGLPLIEIKEVSYEKDGLQIDPKDGTVEVVLDGVRHVIISHDPKLCFMLFDGLKREFISPEGAERLRKYLSSLTEEEREGLTLEEFDRRYQEAIKRRASPQINRNGEGLIESVTWREGYSDETRVFTLTHVAFRSFLEQVEMDRFSRTLTGLASERSSSSTLPSSEAVRAILEAPLLSDKEKEEVIAWLEREKIDECARRENQSLADIISNAMRDLKK